MTQTSRPDYSLEGGMPDQKSSQSIDWEQRCAGSEGNTVVSRLDMSFLCFDSKQNF